MKKLSEWTTYRNGYERISIPFYKKSFEIKAESLNPENLSELEARRWKVIQFKNKFINEKYKSALAALGGVGSISHVKPTHKHNGDPNWWWKYRISDIDGQLMVGFDWIEEPAVKINQISAERFYKIGRILNKILFVKDAVDYIFEEVMKKYLRKNCSANKLGIYHKIVVNGRIYWYRSVESKNGDIYWKKLWSEDEIVEIIV